MLIVPKEHMINLNDAGKNDVPMLGKALRLAAKIADERGVAETGYRVLVNNGEQGGQVVLHLHFHLVGGRPLSPGLG